MAKKKSPARKRKATRDLAPKDARRVKGGTLITVRKAGKGQLEF